MKMEDNPIDLFAAWFAEADAHKDIAEANATCLATAGEGGAPSCRMVLMKGYGRDGFTFYTNLESRKGEQIAHNPHAAMCFYWERLGKQVRIEGVLHQVSDEVADEYFASRPLKSRIGAWASKQSRPLESRGKLLAEVAQQSTRFAVTAPSRPPYWSGFTLQPARIEFWQKGEYRIHDRILYAKSDDGAWQRSLLYP